MRATITNQTSNRFAATAAFDTTELNGFGIAQHGVLRREVRVVMGDSRYQSNSLESCLKRSLCRQWPGKQISWRMLPTVGLPEVS